VINAVTDAIEAMRVSLGATRLLQHCLPGLFHPARKVRPASPPRAALGVSHAADCCCCCPSVCLAFIAWIAGRAH